MNRINPELRITYPRQWLFKIIGADRSSVEKAVEEVLGADGVTIQFSNISSQGAYLAFNVETEVVSRQQLDELYLKLKAHPAVKAVL